VLNGYLCDQYKSLKNIYLVVRDLFEVEVRFVVDSHSAVAVVIASKCAPLWSDASKMFTTFLAALQQT